MTMADTRSRMLSALGGEAPSLSAIDMQVRTGASVPFARYMLSAEAPAASPIDMQVRTGASVPFDRYMLSGEAPAATGVDMQVRTGASVPFDRYMLTADAPAATGIDMQVRTGASVPFASYMLSSEQPAASAIDMQVRTGASVPFAGYMKGAKPAADSVDMQVRTGASVPFNPYMLGAHAEELLKKRVMLSPVLVVWQYRVADEDAFKAFLATREILLAETRIGTDPEIRGVRYGGTYKVTRDGGEAIYKTVWGYTSEVAMDQMHRLCSDDSASATLVQLDLINFVKGMKRFIADAGDRHFTQEVLVSAAAASAAA